MAREWLRTHLLELRFIPGCDVYLCTVLNECGGNGLADPCSSAGYEGCFDGNEQVHGI